jgi:serine/threonine protein phosphatase PrpC
MKHLLEQIHYINIKSLSGNKVALMLLWPMLIILYQGPTNTTWLYAFYGGVGLMIGLFILMILVLLLLLWLRRRKKKSAVAPDLSETQPIPQSDEQVPTLVVSPDLEQTRPGLAITEAETVETRPIVTVSEPETVPVSGQRPTQIGWQIAGLTDVGLKRDLNEDNLLMIEAEMPGLGPYGIYAVADGMGGHERGEVASQLTLRAVQEQFTQHPPTSADAPFDDWLKAAAVAANQAVLTRQSSGNAQERKMGSTLVMALVAENQAHIANVGDSRAYRLDSQGIQQISEDHSLVERLVQIGQLTREEARFHRQRNVIYNTIGDKSNLEVSLYHITLQSGDRLLLCSDGLSNMITDEEILDISRSHASPAEACQKMVEATKSAGGNDNITAVIVQIDAA